MKLATQHAKTRCDLNSVQEVSKQTENRSTSQKLLLSVQGAQTGEMAPDQESVGLSRTHVSLWKKRLFKNTYTRKGRRHVVNEWSVKIQHLGRRKTFALGTTNKELAAIKAKEVYVTIVAKGWEAAEAIFNPGLVVRKDDPTLGDFFREVEAKAGLKPKTLRNYVASFRLIASEIFNLGDNKAKYDYRSGGRAKWVSGVDATKLAAITPDRVQSWKVSFLKDSGTSPLSLLSAKRTVNSYIRCARSLFSRRILKFVKLRLPNPLPFDGIELEKPGTMRYQSKINPELLVVAAKNELRDKSPESYKAFLLGLFCGLRRSEIDSLEWTAIDWANHRIWIGTTEHFNVKTEDSEDFVEVDPQVLDELRSFLKGSASPFVLNSPLLPRPAVDRQYYRCQHVFRPLMAWLRSKGIKANKPLHELRKEFGSQVNLRHGIYAASRALRHSDITTSTRHYVAKQQRVTVGLGHLLDRSSPSVMPEAGEEKIAAG